MTYERDGGEFTASQGQGGQRAQPDAIAISDGGFLDLWLDSRGSAALDVTQARAYDGSGEAETKEFVLKNADGDTFSATAITSVAGGGFLTTWDDYNRSNDSHSIYGQIFDAAGHAAGAVLTLAQGTDYASFTSPAVTALPSGEIVVAETLVDTTIPAPIIKAQVFASSGEPLSKPIYVASTARGSMPTAAVGALTNDRFVVTWNDGQNLDGAIYNRHGKELGSDFQINTPGADGGSPADTRVTALSHGRFAVIWDDYSTMGNGRTGLHAQVFASDGSKTSGELTIDAQGPASGESISIATLNSGGFVVAWAKDDDGSGSTIMAQTFKASGQAMGDAFVVNSHAAGYQLQPTITALSSGGFVVSWVDQLDDHQGGLVYKIEGQKYAVSSTSSGAYAQARHETGATGMASLFEHPTAPLAHDTAGLHWSHLAIA